MAFDPFGSAIGTLATAFRPPSRNLANAVWGRGQGPGGSSLLGGVGSAPVGGQPQGAQGWGLALNRGSSSFDRMGWWQPQPAAPTAQPTPTGQPGTGAVGAAPGEFAVLNQYDDLFKQASAATGVPVNLIKAVAMRERGWEGTSPDGAQGIMQIMPFWGNYPDPASNILKGAQILAGNAANHGGDWGEAVQDYLGRGGADAFGTTSGAYWNDVKGYWDQLNTAGGAYPGSTGGATGKGGLANIWGNKGDYPITQEMGLTDFARGNPLYDYARAYHNFQGHPGLDVGTPSGTQLYAPVGGTVKDAGGTGYYCFYGSCGPGVGQFSLQLDNGDVLILGHMSSITVQVGQRIAAGTPVGLSGGENGDHVHVEYRQADGQGGFYIADPRTALGGTGAITGGAQTGLPTTGLPTGFGGNWWDTFYRTGRVR